MFDWDDVRFILGVTILGFAFPCAMVLGLVTADYVLCNTITSCDNAGEVKK